MDNKQRKELAAKLHDANGFIVNAWRSNDMQTLHDNCRKASELVKEVCESLMDAPGMTDFYGNSTER